MKLFQPDDEHGHLGLDLGGGEVNGIELDTNDGTGFLYTPTTILSRTK